MLQPLPSLVGVGTAPPAQSKIGDLAIKSDPASLWLGCFAQQVASNLEPGSKGLGRHNPTVIPGPRQSRRKSGPAGLRPCGTEWPLTWLEVGVLRRPIPPKDLKEAGLARTCTSRYGWPWQQALRSRRSRPLRLPWNKARPTRRRHGRRNLRSTNNGSPRARLRACALSSGLSALRRRWLSDPTPRFRQARAS